MSARKKQKRSCSAKIETKVKSFKKKRHLRLGISELNFTSQCQRDWNEHGTAGSISDHSTATTGTCDCSTNAGSEKGALKEDIYCQVERNDMKNEHTGTSRLRAHLTLNQNQPMINDPAAYQFRLFFDLPKKKKVAWMLVCFLSSTCAILSKEIGYSAIPVCVVYDLFLRHNLSVGRAFEVIQVIVFSCGVD